MDLFALLSLVGGLALFLYGMQAMGDGLTKLSGGRMEQLLESLTSTRFKGVLLGLAVTAVIQSSSATTVMVVGFVNSGIMKLSQAVGVIMGANIGTTATSWILSLSGIGGDSILLKMVKPSSFSPILAAIGICFLMFSKKEKKHNIGMILLGFAILMFGMDTMSSAVAPLAQDKSFTKLFLMFSNPLLGMLVGLTLTAIIQSSSASVGILQALCTTGIVSFGSAIPIIMGQNIGTCVTALLSSIGTSKNAKRAAMVHLFFNMIGTTLFMTVFYSVNQFVHFAFLSHSASAAGVAVVHSLFNICTVIVLFPVSDWLVKLATLAVPDKKASEEEEKISEDFKRLDLRLTSRPAVAIGQARYVTEQMAKLSASAVREALAMIGTGYDEKKGEKIRAMENTVDQYEDQIGSYMVKLSGKDLSESDSKVYSLLLHNIGNFERISDHAVMIVSAMREMNEKKLHFSNEAVAELKVFSGAVSDILSLTIDSFCEENLEKASYVLPLEKVIDTLDLEEKQRHIRRLQDGRCTIVLGFILSDLTTSLERISDHCRNIALSTLQLERERMDIHGYEDIMEQEENSNYHEVLREMQERYVLPGTNPSQAPRLTQVPGQA